MATMPYYQSVTSTSITQVQFYQNSAYIALTSPTGNPFYIQQVTTPTTAPTHIGPTGYQQLGITKMGRTFLPVLPEGGIFELPDGSILNIDGKGNYTVNDTTGKVTYQAARVRDFNPFLNASDLLEQYISELVPMGVRQDQVLHLEIEHFINWLIHKAAEKDRDEAPKDIPKYPALPASAARRFHRCKHCGRFLRHVRAAAGMVFCSPQHYSAFSLRLDQMDSLLQEANS